MPTYQRHRVYPKSKITPTPVPPPAPRSAQELFEEGRQHHLASNIVRNALSTTWQSIIVPAFNTGNFDADM